MADTPVALGIKSPDLFGRLSQILSIKQQKQALQGQAAEVAGAQQSQQQRAALAKYDFSKHLGEDGTPDLNSMASDPELRAAAGDQYLEVIGKAAGVKEQQLQNKKTLVGLRNDQRSAFAELMGGLRSDADVAQDNEKGRQKINQAMVQYGEMYGEDVLPVLSAYSGQIQKVGQGKMGEALKAIQMQAVSAGDQLSKQQPQYMNTGGEFRQINPNAPQGQSPERMGATIAPGFSMMTDPRTGNPYLINQQTGEIRDAGQGYPGAQPGRGGGQPAPNAAPTAQTRPANSLPAPMQVGELEALRNQSEQNFQNVTANRAAASMAPQQLDQIDKALKLSSEVSTGHWAQSRANIESGLGSFIPGFDPAESDSTKLQLLDKFAERIATDANKVLGVNAQTDAQRESIQKQNANIGYTQKAVQDVLKYAKAQTAAMQAKGDAQESWLKKEGTGITKQHEFETKFRQAYDPRVFQFDVMTPKEQDSYLKTLSKDEKRILKQKTQALIELGAIDGG